MAADPPGPLPAACPLQSADVDEGRRHYEQGQRAEAQVAPWVSAPPCCGAACALARQARPVRPQRVSICHAPLGLPQAGYQPSEAKMFAGMMMQAPAFRAR